MERSKKYFIMSSFLYFHYLSHILDKAKSEIYITDWWFSPEIFLRRPNTCDQWRLHDILVEKAQAGVQVYIHIFGGLGADQLNLGCYGLRDRYNNINNIQFMIHGAGIEDKFMWSHHEKLVVVDQVVAFVGGIDLCAGRFDDESYHLFDEETRILKDRRRKGKGRLLKRHSTASAAMTGESQGDNFEMWHKEKGYMWPGKDYLNSFKTEFQNPHDFMTDSLERKYDNRLPWQDIHSVVYGRAAFDVARHFIQRWNFTKKQSRSETAEKKKPYDEYESLKFILPIPESIFTQRMSELDNSWYCPPPECDRPYANNEPYVGTVQALRSLGEWSGGIAQTENSIYDQYIRLIQTSKRFVYIENQFFVTSSNHGGQKGEQRIKNAIGHALAQRIAIAHSKKEEFKVYVVIPLMPEGPGNPLKMNDPNEMLSHKVIMWSQYTSIARDDELTKTTFKFESTSIFTKLKEMNPEINPDDYFHFGALRKWALKTPGKPVTEVIYSAFIYL